MKRGSPGGSGRALSLAMLLLLSAPGCSYLQDRARDAADIFHAEFSLGPQLGASLRITHIVQAGAQIEGARTGEGAEDVLFETGHLAYNGRWLSVYKRQGAEYGIGPESIEPHLYRRDYRTEYEEEYRDHGRTADEVGFSLDLLLFGVEFGFRPVELFDFLTGWLGVDILKDDNRPGGAENSEGWKAEEERHDGSEEDGVWKPRPKPFTPTK